MSQQSFQFSPIPRRQLSPSDVSQCHTPEVRSGLPARLDQVPIVESGKLLHLVYEIVKFLSYFSFKHINLCQTVLHRRGGGGLVWACIAVLQLFRVDRLTLAPPYTGVGAWLAVPVHVFGADVEPLSQGAVGPSRVHPLAPYTFQVRPSAVVAEQTLPHQPIDQPKVVYEVVLPLLRGPVVPSGIDAVGRSVGLCLAPSHSFLLSA